MNAAKMYCGNGYLAIPNAISLTGWLGGLMLFFPAVLLNIYSMQLCLDVAKVNPELRNYTEVCNKVLGRWGKIAIAASTWIGQLGTCIGYLYFIAD